MVTRVNGAPRQGVWFSADVRFLTITATGGTFLADLVDPTLEGAPATADRLAAVNSGLEQVLEAVATRATVIGMTVASATVVHLMVDYAQAFDAPTLGGGNVVNAVTEVEALINAIPALTVTAFDVEAGFAAAALGTPA